MQLLPSWNEPQSVETAAPMPALIVGSQVRSQLKTVPFLKVVTESLPQGFNKGSRKQVWGHRKLGTSLRTLELWVILSLQPFLWLMGPR